MRQRALFAVAACWMAAGCMPRTMTLPATRADPLVEVVHGARVEDPYRWLEDGGAREVHRWTIAQNAYTRERLRRVPGRERIRARIRELLAVGQISTPVVRYDARGRGRYFYTRRDGLQNQPVLYVRNGLAGADRALIDPNGLAADGTVALDWWFPSLDGKLVAYGLSRRGDEISTLRVRRVETGEDLPDVIDRTRACSLDWLPDGSGFYYTRFPHPGSVPKGEEGYHRQVYFHRLGTDPRDDPRVFGEGRDSKDWPVVSLSPGGRWLVVTVFQGFDRSEVHLLDRSRKEAKWVAIVEKTPARFEAMPLDDRILLRTNLGAPRYRIYSVDPSEPGRATPVIAEEEHVLQGFGVIGGRLFVQYLRNASSVLRVHALDGKLEREVSLRALGTVWGLSGEWNGSEAFYGFSSFAVAPEVHRIDLATGASALWRRIEVPIRPDEFEVRQVRYPSKDGTSISMFLVHRRGLVPNGDHPVYLTGYGGFEISITPAFVGSSYLFLERGGILAMPNLRGGGEYGEAWHKAGMLGNKQNVFDDFIAAAEWLIRERYTRPERLAIAGGSNGGLLVGAALTQRPELFRAVVCTVPLLDMLRYHKFLIGRLWIPEYGSADDPEQFRWLWAYSPYHRVRPGTRYPAVFLAAAESDSRVDPLHARKMAARLQAAVGAEAMAERPILLHIETRAGHGAGKPISKTVRQLTDNWTFLLWQLGMATE